MRQTVEMERELVLGAVLPASNNSSACSGELCLLWVWLLCCARLGSALQNALSLGENTPQGGMSLK